MPTGYTYNIKDGITFKEFTMQCARAFGAYVTMRDAPSNEPAPEKFEVSDYHIKGIKKAKKELSKLENFTTEEAIALRDKEYDQEVKENEKYADDNKTLKIKYIAMLEEVNKWNPPTPDHEGLKKFMIEQIKTSLDFDCMNLNTKPPTKLPVDKWLLAKKKKAIRDIEYHEKEYKEELERVNERNEWIAKLKNSL